MSTLDDMHIETLERRETHQQQEDAVVAVDSSTAEHKHVRSLLELLHVTRRKLRLACDRTPSLSGIMGLLLCDDS